MELKDGLLTINPEMTFNEIKELNNFLKEKIEDISSIEFEEDKAMANSSLISLILSIKMFKPSINIPIQETGLTQITGIGRTVITNTKSK